MGERRHFWEAFLLGMGSVLDLGGTLGPHLPRQALTQEAAARADREALAADWQAVADDLWVIMRQFEQETGERG